jgi:hypothetical protein
VVVGPEGLEDAVGVRGDPDSQHLAGLFLLVPHQVALDVHGLRP